jgi:hypothetical protein
MRRVLLVILTLAAALALVPSSEPSEGAAPPGPGPLAATAPAVPVGGAAKDVVAVYTQRQLAPAVAMAAITASLDVGGAGLVADSGVLGMVSVTRGSRVVQAAPAGMRYPMATTVMAPELAGRVVARNVARALALGRAVMGATTAGLRGARAGDVMTLLGWDGARHRVPIGLVVPDAVIAGPELLIGPGTAAALRLSRPARVVLWGFRSRAAIDGALRRRGLVVPSVRIVHSWDPPNPDDLLSYAQIKSVAGEFAYSGSGYGITLQPGWVAAHIVRGPLGLGVVASCHRVVVPRLQGALAEVKAAGLAGAIDVVNANTYGGCFHASEIAALGSTTGGFVSKHTWAIAFDTNTTTNVETGVPHMDCRVVRIFRKWGFAWGGNFLNSDGMHFEYVAQRRDQLRFPSRYCPNVVTSTAAATLGPQAATHLFWSADADG